jgi:hypothetical protein
MEKLLKRWMEDQIKKHVPLSPMTIQVKAESQFEEVKGKRTVILTQNLC